MKEPVVIKGTKSGIIVVLDKKMEYDDLKKAVAEKFSKSSKFLGAAQVVIEFEGKDITDEQSYELVDTITENSNLEIVCIVDPDDRRESYYNQTLNQRLMELDSNNGQFYKGTLRSGQVLEFQTSVVILGDVNVGAQIVSTGNVVILGTLKGNVFAGASGNENSFVAALHMNPTQIRISDTIARSSDDKEEPDMDPKIAFLEKGNIYIEPLTRDVFGDIKL